MKKLIVSIAVILITLCSSAWADCSVCKDTIYYKKYDGLNDFYMVKFSKNDSITVGHNSYRDIFINTMSGKEINRIEGNCEVFFINNDSNFIRLNPDRKNYEIYDTQTWKVIDTLANDSTSLTYGAATVSSDEKYFVSVFQISALQYGIRMWNIKTKKILQTKILQIDTKLNSLKLFRIRYINNTKIIIGFDEDWYDDSYPKILHNNIYYPIFDANTLDSIDVFALPSDKYYTDYVISKADKYIAFMVADKDYGVHLYDLNTKQLLNKFYTNGPSLTAMEFTSDDKYIITCGGNRMDFWEIDNNYNRKYYYDNIGFGGISITQDNKYINFINGYYLSLIFTHFNDNSVDPDIIKQSITVSPNPTNSTININFALPINEITTISITDILGEKIKDLYNNYIEVGNKEFDISSINTGTYFIVIKNININLTYKIIINK